MTPFSQSGSSYSFRQAAPIIAAARLLRVSPAFLAVHSAPEPGEKMPRPEPCATVSMLPCLALQTWYIALAATSFCVPGILSRMQVAKLAAQAGEVARSAMAAM